MNLAIKGVLVNTAAAAAIAPADVERLKNCWHCWSSRKTVTAVHQSSYQRVWLKSLPTPPIDPALHGLDNLNNKACLFVSSWIYR